MVRYLAGLAQTCPGEPLRLAMHHAGLEFEDIRLTREEFMTKKTSGELRFGQVPALIVQDGSGVPVTLVQTGAIARYIGKLAPQSELYPDDAIKASGPRAHGRGGRFICTGARRVFLGRV